ncbi:periplasmic heavy metal sensor [Duganella sp. FT50W]|uniref:Periplasmic heavy metal sensor n=1 Tax=Duganella lactea TaxID=2692173 RepID=A0A6L8MN10_9BURK|nr:periplasmic heavy metal sensor [Duganella lactea]MYM83611.1 periplasmic heavy metal sensor [Duganella lactea]
MKKIKRHLLLAAVLATPLLTMGGAARADDMHGGPMHAGPPPFARGEPGGPPPFLGGVELTAAQQDQVFAILHAEAPYLREQGKLAANAREALRALAGADQYDDAKAAALAQDMAAAEANLALQRARTQQKLRAVLTPEQRKQQAEEQPRRPPPRP